ncbi:hypothetical protein AAG906_030949 [Vitis piasezkii]
MLRACVLDFGGNWEDYLPLSKFAYNNSYQSSISMVPYEALYGRPYRSPLCWTELGESHLCFRVEEPLQILEVGEHRFKNKVIPTIKVWWQHHGMEEAT